MLAWNGKPISLNGKFFEYNVPTLPPYTIRVATNDGNEPKTLSSMNRIIKEHVYDNVYDVTVTADETNWSGLFTTYDGHDYRFESNISDVISANTTNVTNMNDLFFGVSSCFSSIGYFDTSTVTSMSRIFADCIHISSIPEGFNTSNVTSNNGSYALFAKTSITSTQNIDTKNMKNFALMYENCSSLKIINEMDFTSATSVWGMFRGCVNAEEGISATYNIMKNNPRISAAQSYNNPHAECFRNCGINSPHGSAELALIPTGWK